MSDDKKVYAVSKGGNWYICTQVPKSTFGLNDGEADYLVWRTNTGGWVCRIAEEDAHIDLGAALKLISAARRALR